ncbi:MFS transporter [Saccharopolyspora rosea]|uniref:MFS transporter n=1 Tax=Saccharopolyspora rosea TaxID=524884 RepID=A0ABW3G474_9PSEU
MPPAPGTAPTRRTKIRWLMVLLAFLAIAINYVDRANLSVALPYMNAELGLSPELSGLLLGAFFWTYSVFQIPLGRLVDRFGTKVMFAAAVAWWSLFTAATAVARGFASLFAVRLLLGLGEAGAFPACTKLVEEWFPRRERATASGIYDSGARGGTMLAIPIVTALVMWLGWRGSFVITGSIGLVWVAVWWWLYRRPREHPWVSEAELEHIEQDAAAQTSEADQVRWQDLLRNRTVWGMALGFACQAFVIYFFITWFPSYLVDERGFSLLELGIFGTLPGIVAFAGNFLGGAVSDRLVRRGHSLTFARKSCIVGGMLGSSVIALAAVVDSSWLALALLAFSFGSVTFATTCIVTLPTDIAPRSAKSCSGTIQGIQNAASNVAGAVSPALIGLIYGFTGSFVGGLVAAGAVAVLACLIYLFVVGDIEPLPLPEGATHQSAAADSNA